MNRFPKKLSDKIHQRVMSNSLRALNSYAQDEIDFVSNDYLGFASNRSIQNRTQEIFKKYNFLNGSTGSRLISGNHSIHLDTENTIADWHNAESALLYNSGYDANVGLLSSVPQRGDVILYDELIHASIRDGIRLSMSKSYRFLHNDLNDLQNKIDQFHGKSDIIYICIESVYSMDGDVSPVKEFVDMCMNYPNIRLIIDEAHSTGVFGGGKGCVCKLGLEEFFFARVHTFGKAMGCHGAAILGNKELREYLINFSRSFIYTTALSIHSVATIQAAYKELLETDQVGYVLDNISFFRNIVDELSIPFIESMSPIQCCIVGGNDKVKEMEMLLSEKKYNVKAVLSPTVSQGKERLRICIHSFNTKQQIKELLMALKEVYFE